MKNQPKGYEFIDLAVISVSLLIDVISSKLHHHDVFDGFIQTCPMATYFSAEKKYQMSALVVQMFLIGSRKMIVFRLRINDDTAILNYANDLRWYHIINFSSSVIYKLKSLSLMIISNFQSECVSILCTNN